MPHSGRQSMTSTTQPVGLRERKKAQTRRRIQQAAMALFFDKGYEATTVEQIAAAADVSAMTFFRYFPTKEAVVEQDEYDPMLAEAISRRPADEPPLVAMHTAMQGLLGRVYAVGRDLLWQRTRLGFTTPALRAHFTDNQFATQHLLAEALAARGGGTGPATLQLRVQAAAFLSAILVALDTWVAEDGAQELPDLVDQTCRGLIAATTATAPSSTARSRAPQRRTRGAG